MTKIITRFAPSPTGYLHAGNYRTAIFAYLFAKHEQGEFILRIEDTDRERSKVEYETNILEALAWLGLGTDRQYRQSDHTRRHHELLGQLIKENKAYVSKEDPKMPGARVEVVRFRNPGGQVMFTDIVRGNITMEVGDLGDFVIARSLDEPVFHFAVVVDDADENITHIIRGEDHISNTPRQILIQRALSFPTPSYAHLPLILNDDRTKLSKRKGARAITEYRDLGFLPEGLINYLAYLGWNPGDEREYLSHSELVASFDIARVQRSSAIFDETKLLSVNQHWMRQLTNNEFIARGHFSTPNADRLLRAIPLLKERAQTFGEAHEILSGELSCLFEAPVLEKEKLLAKEPGGDRPGTTYMALETFLELLEAIPEDGMTADGARAALMPLADAEEMRGKGGRGAVLWPLRYALSGQERSPDPFTLISILGKNESLARIRYALHYNIQNKNI